jgi:hypothetical protein
MKEEKLIGTFFLFFFLLATEQIPYQRFHFLFKMARNASERKQQQ